MFSILAIGDHIDAGVPIMFKHFEAKTSHVCSFLICFDGRNPVHLGSRRSCHEKERPSTGARFCCLIFHLAPCSTWDNHEAPFRHWVQTSTIGMAHRKYQKKRSCVEFLSGRMWMPTRLVPTNLQMELQPPLYIAI